MTIPVGQTLAAHPKGQVYIDRLTSHHREHIKDVAAVSQALDPGAYIAVLMAGWHDVFEPLQPPIAVPFALLDKVRRIRNDGYHHNPKLADEGYIEDSLAAVEALRSALARAARQRSRTVSAPNIHAGSASDGRKSPPTSTTRPNAFVDSVEFANNPEPRCSVVLMVDVSGSMNGAPIKALNDGLAAFAREIKQDTVAMMRAVITIIRRDDMRPRRQRLQHRRRRRPRCERRRVGAPFQLRQAFLQRLPVRIAGPGIDEPPRIRPVGVPLKSGGQINRRRHGPRSRVNPMPRLRRQSCQLHNQPSSKTGPQSDKLRNLAALISSAPTAATPSPLDPTSRCAARRLLARQPAAG